MHMLRGNRQTVKNDQRGMAALVVVMVMMFVISVTVLGFAQVVRREQRNVLDNQLSTQAYYAAESGLNLAQAKVKEKLLTGTPPAKDRCTDDAGYGFTTADFKFTDVAGNDQNAEITCVLIDPELEYLEYQRVGMTAVPLLVKAKSGTITNIFISWETTSAGQANVLGNGCDGGNTFEPTTAAWDCAQPLLRLDLVPTTAGATTAINAANAQFTTFLSPKRGPAAAPVNYATIGTSGVQVNAIDCRAARGSSPDNPRKCTANISVASISGAEYALRLMSIYGDSNVTVFAKNSSGTLVTLIGGQIQVDVTARAADVLKRLQARMPVGGSTPVPDFAVSAGGGVCKRYQIAAGVPSTDTNECRIPN